jgi:hypothetical protein
MDLERFNKDELLRSLEAECAKALGELRCLLGDADKINSRLRFILAVIHNLKDRKD